MHSVKIFIKRREIHLEAMLVVALVAVARKSSCSSRRSSLPQRCWSRRHGARAHHRLLPVKRAGREAAGTIRSTTLPPPRPKTRRDPAEPALFTLAGTRSAS